MQKLRDEFLPRLELSCEGHLSESEPVMAEAMTILLEMKDFIDQTYARPEGMYSKVRRMITERIPWLLPAVIVAARQVLKQNQHDFKALQKKAEKVVAFKNSHQTVFTMAYIREVVTRLKASHVFSDNVVLLMLSCGARKIEILDASTSTFFGHNDLKDRITQCGVAKRRAEGKDDNPITKPLLFLSPGDFIMRLTAVREEVEERGKKGRVAIGKTFSHQLEKLCQELWPQHVDNGYRTGTHVNRAIYANVAYRMFGVPGESLTHFIKTKLGHDTMGTAAHYMNISVAFDEDSPLAEEAERQAVVLEQNKVVLENKDGYQHEFVKPPMRWMEREDREELARNFAKQLQVSGIPVTRQNLIELGVQSKIVTSSGVLLAD